jgi:ribulose 1,5-bisphosphate carboxylase large subunit-like protein
MNCRLPIKFLCLVELPAEKDLLALQVGNGLLNHPAQKAAGELAFRVM